MSVMSKWHQELNENGVGKCSVPMWRNGMPSGFCDEPAYGTRPDGDTFIGRDNQVRRYDGKYAGYVPSLACPSHGGPEKPKESK